MNSNDVCVKLEEVKEQIDYLRKHYHIIIKTKKETASISLEYGNITKLLKINNDKRKYIIDVLDTLNKNKILLYYAITELNII